MNFFQRTLIRTRHFVTTVKNEIKDTVQGLRETADQVKYTVTDGIDSGISTYQDHRQEQNFSREHSKASWNGNRWKSRFLEKMNQKREWRQRNAVMDDVYQANWQLQEAARQVQSQE